MPRMYHPNIDDIPDAPDPIVPGEYDFTIASYEQKADKNGRLYYKILGSFTNGPTAMNAKGETVDYEGRPYTFTIYPDNKELDGEYWRSKAMKWKAFLTSGQIPWDEEGYDSDDFINAELRLQLGMQKNSEYTEVKRFLEH